ncbi:MAG TPA: prolyl oligopeptidase family serine peptidase [Gemmatimonadales bacterium]|nr:prolyl oligopeptidase family serine peptidase [Gemmatimonadales bacterium]
MPVILTAAVLLVPALLAAQFFDRSSVRDGAISADASLVAFTIREPAPGRDAFGDRVVVIPAGGGDQRPVGAGGHPAFAPTSSAIARLIQVDGIRSLVVRDSLAGEDRTLTGHNLDVGAFHWSPDGSRIAFTARSFRSAGAARSSVAGDAGMAQALFVVDASGGDVRRLTAVEFAIGPAEPELPDLREFDWLDAGRLVVAGRDLGGNEPAEASSLFVVDVAGGQLRYLVGTGGRWHLPRVSPKGDWIAFTGQALGANWMASEVIVIRPDATGLRRLTVGLDRDALDLAWADDSRTIWFATEDRGSRNLHRVDSRNGRVTDGTTGTHILALEALSRRGDWALATRRTATSAGMLIRFPLDKPHLFQVLAEPAPAQFDGEIEELDIATPAGLNLHGWLFRPVGAETSRPLPLVIDIHGGPHAMAGAGYAPDALAYAAAGSLVLRLNPRGSTGFGFDILNGLGDRWPGVDVDDLRAVLDTLIGRGMVDTARITVAGTGSGAVTAAALAAVDQRIRKVVLHCPGGAWLPGGSGVDRPIWSEWYAARPFRSTAPRWWQQWDRWMRPIAPRDLVLIMGTSNTIEPAEFGEAWITAQARSGASATVVRLPGGCGNAGPETQKELWGFQ